MTMTEALPVASGHSHSAARASRKRLQIVLGLVVAYLVVEVVGSLITNSLALLADDHP
jgi:cobalt-zinc-cadmium efflux system protein